MSRHLARLALWVWTHVCAECRGWIWRDNHRGEHADCYHARRRAVYRRGVEQWKPLEMPDWLNPCPDCGATL